MYNEKWKTENGEENVATTYVTSNTSTIPTIPTNFELGPATIFNTPASREDLANSALSMAIEFHTSVTGPESVLVTPKQVVKTAKTFFRYLISSTK